MSKSPSMILDGLCSHFMAIYTLWDEKQSAALARHMLEQDIMKLGLYLGNVDEFGQLAELTLVAECIAYIRIHDSTVDQRRMIDYWTDIVMEELQDKRLIRPHSKESMNDIVEQLQTWLLAKELVQRGRISTEMMNILIHHFIELADLFFLRDGHITSQEMVAMREFEQALRAI